MTCLTPLSPAELDERPVYDDRNIDPSAIRGVWCAKVLCYLQIAGPKSTMTVRSWVTPKNRELERQRSLDWLRGRECRAIFEDIRLDHKVFCEAIADGVPDINASMRRVTKVRTGLGAILHGLTGG